MQASRAAVIIPGDRELLAGILTIKLRQIVAQGRVELGQSCRLHGISFRVTRRAARGQRCLRQGVLRLGDGPGSALIGLHSGP
jgi:hypothetical protein